MRPLGHLLSMLLVFATALPAAAGATCQNGVPRSYDDITAIQGYSLIQIAKATGLSIAACSRIRAGTRVPRPRHWEALRELGEEMTDR
jgi:hypothetical protein